MPNTLRLFLAGLTVGAASSEAIVVGAPPPNLIVIVTDDHGYADVGFNGCEDIPTPGIDRIAEEGVRCTSGYVTHSVCGPSRAALITGRYQCRFGASRNPTVDPSVPNNGVPRSEQNLAELLRPRGYHSMAVGKWHLGTHPDLRPLERGFDEFFGFLTGGHDYFPERLTLEDLSEVDARWAWYRTKLLRNETRVSIDGYLTEELSDAAVDFIDRNHTRPFFLYLAYNAPHTPMQATEELLARFDHIEDKKRRTYAAMVSAVDDGVARVLAKLDEHALQTRTIVFFLSDNGGATNNASRNTPLRGYKRSPFEGGVRVPFAVRWTGTIPAGIDYDRPVSSLDIAATIVRHAGAQASIEKPLDGVDLVPFLTGEREDAPHEALYWRWFDDNRYAARFGESKLIVNAEGSGESLLFDLDRDLAETEDLSKSHPGAVESARQRIDTWTEGLTDPLCPGLGSWNPKRR